MAIGGCHPIVSRGVSAFVVPFPSLLLTREIKAFHRPPSLFCFALTDFRSCGLRLGKKKEGAESKCRNLHRNRS